MFEKVNFEKYLQMTKNHEKFPSSLCKELNPTIKSFLANCDLTSADNLCKQFGPRSGPTE